MLVSGDYHKSWSRARQPSELCQQPNFYVHAPCRTDPSAAPPGCDSIMVLLPVANIQERGGQHDYHQLVAAGRQAVLDTLRSAGTGDIERHIVHEHVIDPLDWQQR